MAQQKSEIRRLTDNEMSAFCGQMASILCAGISVQEGLALMLDDAQAGEEDLLQCLQKGMEQSGSLAEAMRGAKAFPHYALSMITIGESTGRLDEVLAALDRHYAREDALTRSIRSALVYPAVMAGMMAAVVVILLVKILPIFQQVFLQLGTEMSGLAALLLRAGTLLGRYSAAFAVLLVLQAAFALFLILAPTGKRLRGKLARATGFGRRLADRTAACRFAGAMALALKGGLVPEEALELAAELNEDQVFGAKLDACRAQLQTGESFSRVLNACGILSGVQARAAALGERIGQMDQAMEQIALQLQDEIDTQTSGAVSAMEPTLVIALSIIVGVILLSVMLPLLGIMSGI